MPRMYYKKNRTLEKLCLRWDMIALHLCSKPIEIQFIKKCKESQKYIHKEEVVIIYKYY